MKSIAFLVVGSALALDLNSPKYLLNQPLTPGKASLLEKVGVKKLDVLELNPGYLTEQQIVNSAWIDAKMDRYLPGIGSGVNVDPKTKVLMAIADRGPNADCPDGKVLLLPELSPAVTSLKVDSNNNLEVFKATPLLNSDRKLINGKSNFVTSEKIYQYDCKTPSLPDLAGMDTEDLAIHPNGVHFFGSEEYSPSVFVADITGKILVRYVPASLATGFASFTGYPVSPILPEIFAQRRDNRGFESLALSNDGKFLWTLLQSPIGDAKNAKYKDTTTIRVLKLDVSDPLNAKVAGMYAFKTSSPKDFAGAKAKDIKYSGAKFLVDNVLLLLERVDDAGLRMHITDFNAATNLIGTEYEKSLNLEDTTLTPSVNYATKEMVFDMFDLPEADRNGLGLKIEGLDVVAPSTAVVISDNDFGLDGIDTYVYAFSLRKKLPGIADVSFVNGTNSCPFEYNYRDWSYFVIPGPADDNLLTAACNIRGAEFVSSKTSQGLCKFPRSTACQGVPDARPPFGVKPKCKH